MGSDRPYEWLTYRIEKNLQHKSNLFKLFTSANGLEFKQINPIRKSEKRYQTRHADSTFPSDTRQPFAAR